MLIRYSFVYFGSKVVLSIPLVVRMLTTIVIFLMCGKAVGLGMLLQTTLIMNDLNSS